MPISMTQGVLSSEAVDDRQRRSAAVLISTSAFHPRYERLSTLGGTLVVHDLGITLPDPGAATTEPVSGAKPTGSRPSGIETSC